MNPCEFDVIKCAAICLKIVITYMMAISAVNIQKMPIKAKKLVIVLPQIPRYWWLRQIEINKKLETD